MSQMSSSSTAIGQLRSPRAADEYDKRKWDELASDDDEEPLMKRARVLAPSPPLDESLCAASSATKPLHRSVVPYEPSGPPAGMKSAPAAQPVSPPGKISQSIPVATTPNCNLPPLPPSTSDAVNNNADPDPDDDWDEWVLNTRGTVPLEPISPEQEDLHWAELERVHQISPSTPAPAPVFTTPEPEVQPLRLPPAAADEIDELYDDESDEASPPGTLLSPSLAPYERVGIADRETMSPLTEAEDDVAESSSSSGKAVQPPPPAKANSSARAANFSRLAEHDQFLDFRARNIDGERIQCDGCGRWMKTKSWEKHLKDICPVYLIQPVLPTPARALLAKAKAREPQPRDSEPDDVSDEPIDFAAMREKLESDSRAKDVSSNSVQCAGCNRWIKFRTWQTHITRTCRTLKKKSQKKYWVYVSEDDED